MTSWFIQHNTHVSNMCSYEVNALISHSGKGKEAKNDKLCLGADNSRNVPTDHGGVTVAVYDPKNADTIYESRAFWSDTSVCIINNFEGKPRIVKCEYGSLRVPMDDNLNEKNSHNTHVTNLFRGKVTVVVTHSGDRNSRLVMTGRESRCIPTERGTVLINVLDPDSSQDSVFEGKTLTSDRSVVIVTNDQGKPRLQKCVPGDIWTPLDDNENDSLFTFSRTHNTHVGNNTAVPQRIVVTHSEQKNDILVIQPKESRNVPTEAGDVTVSLIGQDGQVVEAKSYKSDICYLIQGGHGGKPTLMRCEYKYFWTGGADDNKNY